MRKSTVLSVGLISPATVSAPTVYADSAFNNEGNSVRCEHYTVEDGATIWVSDRASAAQPECTPSGAGAPAVAIERNWVETKRWNQGQTGAPENLRPMTVRQYGQVVAFAAPGGDIYVFDTKKFALVKAGSTNQVVFPGFSRCGSEARGRPNRLPTSRSRLCVAAAQLFEEDRTSHRMACITVRSTAEKRCRKLHPRTSRLFEANDGQS